jgi:hypothetical protein
MYLTDVNPLPVRFGSNASFCDMPTCSGTGARRSAWGECGQGRGYSAYGERRLQSVRIAKDTKLGWYGPGHSHIVSPQGIAL